MLSRTAFWGDISSWVVMGKDCSTKKRGGWWLQPSTCKHCLKVLSSYSAMKKHAAIRPKTGLRACGSSKARTSPAPSAAVVLSPEASKKVGILDRLAGGRALDLADLVVAARALSGAGLPVRVKAAILVDIAALLKEYHFDSGLALLALEIGEHILFHTPSCGFVLCVLIAEPLECPGGARAAINEVIAQSGSCESMNTCDGAGKALNGNQKKMESFYASLMKKRSKKPGVLVHFKVVASFLKPGKGKGKAAGR